MNNIQESLTPKVYPLWHSTTISKHSCSACHNDMKLLPDHGGAGVDVEMLQQCADSKEVSRQASAHILKSEVPTKHFASRNCVLPLFYPNSVKNLLDPCSEHLRHLQAMQKKYALSMFHISHGFSKHRKKCYLKLKAELSTKNWDEFIVPKKIFELAESKPEVFPVPRANWLYSGGCLSSVVYTGINDGMPFLVHPGGVQLSDIVITSVAKNSHNYDKLVSSTQQKFHLGDSPIFQVSVQSFNQNIMGCIRQKQNYYFFSGQIDDICTENFYEVKEKISYCSVSPYILGEHVVLTKNHIILKNADRSCATWDILQQMKGLNSGDSWQGCDFGSHPRCVSYCNCRTLSLIDLRIKNNKSLQIFNTSSPHLFQKEELMLSKLNVSQPYQHFLATNHHMLLCDERFTQQPLSVWNHLLDSSSMYCNILNYSENNNTSELHVLLGSHLPQQVAYFSLTSPTYRQIHPVSTTPPFHLSVPVDIAEYLKLHCVTLEESTIKRLSSPLIGACSSLNTQGFLFFQLTSFGDVFYQTYLRNHKTDEKSHSIGPGCSFLPPFNISDVDWWIDETRLTSNNISNPTSLEPLMQTDCSKEFEGLYELSKSQTGCCLCSKNNSECSSVETCLSCGIRSSDGKCILKASKLNTVIRQVTSKISDMTDYLTKIKNEFYYNNMDPLSKSMYDTWFKGTPDELAEQCLEQNSFCGTTDFKTKLSQNGEEHSNTVSGVTVLDKDANERFDEMEDEIPPSQEISQLIGETVRLSIPRKKRCLATSDGF